MDEKDIQRLLELAEQQLKEPVSPEQALRNLVDAGILDENGQHTAPFRELLDNTAE